MSKEQEAQATSFMLIEGYPCTPVCLPMCDGGAPDRAELYKPPSEMTAGEFARNKFSRGKCFNPMINRKQQTALEAKCAKAGDEIVLMRHGNKHVVEDFFLEWCVEQQIYTPTACYLHNNMQGMVISMFANLYDCDGCFIEDAGIVPGDMKGVDVGAFEDEEQCCGCLWAAVPNGGFLVPEGQFLEVGFTIDTMPDNCMLDMMSGKICVHNHVKAFDMPQHTG